MRFTTKALGLAAALVASASTASAQAGIPISGSAMGCFFFTVGGSCTPTQSASAFGGALTYYGAQSFSGTSQTNGTRGFGGNPATSFAGNQNNFGSFQVANSMTAGAQSGFFTLMLTFSQPQAATGTYNATVTGEVRMANDGSFTVDFPASLNQPNFAPVVPSGGLIRGVQVNDVTIEAGQVASVTGSVAVVPEPSTYALLGTGLAGLLAAGRRRRAVA